MRQYATANTQQEFPKKSQTYSFESIAKEIQDGDTITINHSISPVVVHYTIEKIDSESNEFPTGYSLINISIFDIKMSKIIQAIHDSSIISPEIYCLDANGDGYNDICYDHGISGMSMLGYTHRFWLYSPISNKFQFSKDFDDKPDFEITPADSLITFTAYFTGARGEYSYTCKIKFDKLITIHTYDEMFHDVTEKELIDDTLQIIKKREEKEYSQDQSSLTTYQWLFDSLRVTEILWQARLSGHPTEQQIKGGIAMSEPWGVGYLYTKKEIRNYEKTQDSKIIEYRKYFKVIDQHWTEVDGKEYNK